MDHRAPVYVAGHRGLVGSAIWRRLEAAGFTHLIGASSSELDLLILWKTVRAVIYGAGAY